MGEKRCPKSATIVFIPAALEMDGSSLQKESLILRKKTAIAARLLNQASKCLYPLSPLKRKQSDFILTAHNVTALKASPLHTRFWRPFWLPSSLSQHESHP